MWHVWRIGDDYRGFWSTAGGEKEHLEDRGVSGRTILKWIFTQLDGEWTGFLWFRIGTGDGLL